MPFRIESQPDLYLIKPKYALKKTTPFSERGFLLFIGIGCFSGWPPAQTCSLFYLWPGQK